MIDTYLKTNNRDALDALRSFVTNITQVVQGEIGKGNPDYWYACIRAPFPIPAFEGVEIADAAEGANVCGVWSD